MHENINTVYTDKYGAMKMMSRKLEEVTLLSMTNNNLKIK